MFKVTLLYWLAATLALAGLIAHELVGAPMVLSPLADTQLPPEVIWLHHFSWHVGSIAVFTMVILFVIAALKPEQKLLAVIATAMSLAFALLGIGLGLFGSAILWSTPAPYVWSVVAAVGMVGLVSDKSLSAEKMR